MVATKPPDDAQTKNLTFAQILNGAKPNPRKLQQGIGRRINEDVVIHSNPTIFKGEPAFLLTKDEDDKLAEPFQFAVIGKFSKGKLTMEYLWNQFQKIGFKALVWVAFEGLPIHRFNEKYLCKLASIIGNPLKIDVSRLNMSRPSIARVCVKIDLLNDFPQRIRLRTEESSYYQPVSYENLPDYYLECHKLGHLVKDCRHLKGKRTGNEDAVTQKQPAQSKVATPVVIAKSKVQINKAERKQKEREPEKPVSNAAVKETSTSGLSVSEKAKIPIDIEHSSPQFNQTSSTKRQFSKDQLCIVLQNTQLNDILLDLKEDEEQQLDPVAGNMDRQIVVF
ncbi:OLC1v1000927C1 [Oldenlandia corymbosa var. corymbosa]|uniref:OLC1v1000927C1 n=1 Tax=Oldenlandia corymbosa var. corymbosa TaxID=529605 RepID=A0AAV1D6E3_OLDCO|nr:OLC1v1000927C1 [Oldenlandia corymbosa var. corymbosa]